jgi:flagellar protein FlaG
VEIQTVSDNSINRVIEKKIPGQEEVPSGEIQQEGTYNKTEINKEITHLNKWLDSKGSHLHFVLHDKLNEYYVQVVNDNTNEVIKEIPSKKVMDMVANFYEKLGIIVDKKI